MIRAVTYSADNMTTSRKLCVESLRNHGAEMVYEYEEYNIDRDFRINNADILNATRGAGYWLWKPWCINRAIQHSADGDVLIYCDAGVAVVDSLHHIINAMDQDIFFFSNGHQHVHWCKMDCIKAICGEVPVSQQQVQASAIFFKVNQKTRKFIKEWLLWCQMPGMIDDSPSVLPNHPEFAQHRYDQAILTCLQIKHGYKQHWWADRTWYQSQRYRWPDDKYPPIFNHHRKRNAHSGTGDVEWENTEGRV